MPLVLAPGKCNSISTITITISYIELWFNRFNVEQYYDSVQIIDGPGTITVLLPLLLLLLLLSYY